MILSSKFISRGLDEMIQGLKWGILQFSIMYKYTFGDTARIEFVYFSILCSNFVISYKNAEMGKWKISHFQLYLKKCLRCIMSQFNPWNFLFWPSELHLCSRSYIFGCRKQNICALFFASPFTWFLSSIFKKFFDTLKW